MITGDLALAKLARLKLRGALRKQVRRLDRPSNVLFAVVGLVLMALWLGVLALRGGGAPAELSPDQLRRAITTAALLLAAMTAFSSLAHRGLYLPAAEIELLLAAPVARADLVRYRVLSSSARALFGGVVLGLVAGRHMPHAGFGFAGAFLGALLLPVLGQGVSLLAGSAENRLSARLARLPMRWINLVFVVVLLFVFTTASGVWDLSSWMRELDLAERLRGLIEHPLVGLLGLPFRPWARMMTASDALDFARWAALGLCLHALLFEAVARIPVDFRELSLSTSADVARRLRRFQKSGSGSASWEVSRGAAGRRVPWLFGRGPAGAIAWRKSAAILRKARGTLVVGAAIIGLLTALSTTVEHLGGTDEGARYAGPLLIAAVGTIYLCAGLRFDFREDLDQMEVIKSWPLAPWKLFLATILPQVAVVSAFIAAGIGVRGALTGDVHIAQLAIAGLVPLLVILWSSIDNALFLYAPIRYTAGQEGALHHAGRALLLMLLRLVCFAGTTCLILLGMLCAFLLQYLFDLSERTFGILGLTFGLLALLGQVAGLIALGGVLLARFDVARDRG